MGMLSIHHRVEMCEQAVKDSDWISVSRWEGYRKDFSLPYEILEYVNKLVNEEYHAHLKNENSNNNNNDNNNSEKEEDNIRVMFVCGFDLLYRMRGT